MRALAVLARERERELAEARRWWRGRDPTGVSLCQSLDAISRRWDERADALSSHMAGVVADARAAGK